MRLVPTLALIVSLMCLPGPATAFTHEEVQSDAAIQSVRLDTDRFSETGAYVDVTVKAHPGGHVGVRLEGGQVIPAVEHSPGLYMADVIRYSHAAAATTDVVAYLQDSEGQSWSRSFTVTETLLAEVHQSGVPEPQDLQSSVAESDATETVTEPTRHVPSPTVETTDSLSAPASSGQTHYEEIPLAPSDPVSTPATTDAKIIRTSNNPYFDNSTVELLRQSYAGNTGADEAVDSRIDPSKPHQYNNTSIDNLRQSYSDDTPATVANTPPAVADPTTGLGGKASNDPPPPVVVVHGRPEFDPPAASPAGASPNGGEAAAPPTVTDSAPPGYGAGDSNTPSAQSTAQPPAPQYTMPYGGYDQAPPVAPPVPAHH